jgi:ABC-2 type transport system permease protein
LPYLPVAIIQAAALLGVGALLGLEVNGSIWLVALILFLMSIMYTACGMIFGATFGTKTVSFPYMVILLLTIFGGAWMDLEAIGGVFRTMGDVLPFAHALDATRAVMINGAGMAAVSGHLYWVLGYTVATVVIAVFVFRRRMVL